MSRETPLDITAVAVLLGGFVALLFSFYFMQQLSYSIGVFSGISSTINAYNLSNRSISTTLLAAISQSTTLALALHITYAMLPFAVMMLAIGIIWLFSNQYFKFTESVLVISALMYIIILAILQFDFSFKNVTYAFPAAYVGGLVPLMVGSYLILKVNTRSPLSKKTATPITINPDTPYSNMKMLSNRLMKRLSGEIKILDMHFDVKGLDNLIQLVDKNLDRYTKINVLTNAGRLGEGFWSSYTDFKNELANKNVAFELRVVDENRAAKQHERLLMDSALAYKIPPLNIINKKSEHIVSINVNEAQSKFNHLWSEATKFENIKSNSATTQ